MVTRIGKDIDMAAKLLSEGGLVAIPTETVYGLAANALQEDAILKIYEAKERPRFNPLILHVPHVEVFERYASVIPNICYDLAQAFSPGPITFLLKKSNVVPALATAGSEYVALRIPAHPMTQTLLQSIPFPLAAPSANPSGYVSPVNAQHVMDGLGGRIPYVLDGGSSVVGLESTIISFEGEDIFIHRHGAVTADQIMAVSGILPKESLGGQIHAPGGLKSHYATQSPLIVGDVQSLLEQYRGQQIAVISFQKTYHDPAPAWSCPLSPAGDLKEAARNLFHTMRELDKQKPDCILAERFPEQGLGIAINDRLNRAQSLYRA